MRLRSECVRERGVGDTHLMPDTRALTHGARKSRRLALRCPRPRGAAAHDRRTHDGAGPGRPNRALPHAAPGTSDRRRPRAAGLVPRTRDAADRGRRPRRGPSRGPRDQRSSPPPVPAAVTPDDVNEQRAGWRWAVAVREGGRPHGFEEARRTRSIAGRRRAVAARLSFAPRLAGPAIVAALARRASFLEPATRRAAVAEVARPLTRPARPAVVAAARACGGHTR